MSRHPKSFWVSNGSKHLLANDRLIFFVPSFFAPFCPHYHTYRPVRSCAGRDATEIPTAQTRGRDPGEQPVLQPCGHAVEPEGERTRERTGQGNTAEDRRPGLGVHGPESGYGKRDRRRRSRGRCGETNAPEPGEPADFAAPFGFLSAEEPGRYHSERYALVDGRQRRRSVRTGT